MRKNLRTSHRLLWLFSALSLGVNPVTLRAECDGDFIVSPSADGADGQCLLENFYTLVGDLTHSAAMKRVSIGGESYLVPPWYDTPEGQADNQKCIQKNLHTAPNLPNPTYGEFAIVSDQISELALVIALSDDPTAMVEIDRTITAMNSSVATPIPCWVAKVTTSPAEITCLSADTATDATVRIGLAYYHAANNPHFSATDRQNYLTRANELADLHLSHEYVDGAGCFQSEVTDRWMCSWIAGGLDAAQHGLSGLKMWIGYHQDVANFLLAAYHATGIEEYRLRAEDVIDQWLMASEFDGTNLTFGRLAFKWEVDGDTLRPVRDPDAPEDWYWWEDGRAWDVEDAPRALWMGHVLRANDLLTQSVPLSGPIASLVDWSELVLAGETQKPATSCVQYNRDGCS